MCVFGERTFVSLSAVTI